MVQCACVREMQIPDWLAFLSSGSSKTVCLSKSPPFLQHLFNNLAYDPASAVSREQVSTSSSSSMSISAAILEPRPGVFTNCCRAVAA